MRKLCKWINNDGTYCREFAHEKYKNIAVCKGHGQYLRERGVGEDSFSPLKRKRAQQNAHLTGFPPSHRDEPFCECDVCMGFVSRANRPQVA